MTNVVQRKAVMGNWDLFGRVCSILVLLCVADGLVGEETGRQVNPGGQAAARGEAVARDGAVRGAIEKVFRAQQDAWNRGDIPAFMEYYWKSDDLTFSSNG